MENYVTDGLWHSNVSRRFDAALSAPSFSRRPFLSSQLHDELFSHIAITEVKKMSVSTPDDELLLIVGNSRLTVTRIDNLT